MTIDKEEIKEISLACDPSKCADEAEEDRRLAEFYSELTPETVLALLAEIERLEAVAFAMNGAGTMELIAERDQLKAENEALRKELNARHPFKPAQDAPVIGYAGCLVCGEFTDHGGLTCPKMRAYAQSTSDIGGHHG
jgi:hypothetical protein